jgi:TonB-dependent starch-binding outer membrane protein SusC
MHKTESFQTLIRLMKLSLSQLALALVIVGVSLARDVTAQELLNRKVSLHLANQELISALAKLEQQANVKFTYRPKLLTNAQRVSLDADNEPLVLVLDKLLAPLRLRYRVISNQIILSPQRTAAATDVPQPLPVLQPDPNAELPAEQIVSGRVSDENGAGLPGVSIVQKGTQRGTTTSTDGKYSLNVPNGQAVLVFSFVGYATQELEVGNRATLNVSLALDNKSLNEVVVVGYGTQKKENLTGSVAAINVEAIKDRPLPSASVALQGTVPGVFINQNSGQPGRNSVNIRIRGVGTLNNAAPLVLVDGIEAPIDNINAEDIASITVLKDAASAAIYGSRAANGVVLVTTKRGKNLNGRINLTYNGYAGATEATRLPNMVTNSLQFATLRNEASTNFGNPPTFDAAALKYFQEKGPNTDWFALAFKPGSIQQHTLGIDGGNEATRYRLSLGYLTEDGVSPRSGADRLTGRFNLDTKPLDKLTFSTNLSLVRGRRNSSQDDLIGGRGSIIWRAAEAVPTFPAYDEQGRLARPNNQISGPNLGNPLESLWGNEFSEKSLDLLGNISLEYTPLPGLALSGLAAVNYRTLSQETFSPSFSGFDFITGEETKFNPLRGRSRTAGESSNTTLILKATYEKVFGLHATKVLVGFNQENAVGSRFGAGRNGFISDNIRVLNVGNPKSATNFENGTTWGLRSYFGRVNYGFNDRYLFEANVRLDGTSRFENKKWGVFPSFSAGWLLSKEAFFAPLSGTFDLFKIRASWGRLGNQVADPNDDFIYAKQLSLTQNYNFGGTIVPGVAQTTLGNPDLTWETTTVTDIGLDLSLWKSKVTATADYFIRDTRDILFSIPVSSLTGFTSQIANTAKVQNKGWELGLNYDDNVGDFRFSVGGNVTHVTSTIQQLNPDLKPGEPDRFIYGVDNRRVAERGGPLNALYGVPVVGIFQTKAEIDAAPDHRGLNPNFGPGDLRFADTNGDGKISNDDRVIIGKEDPTWLFGMNFRASFKGFDIAGLFNGAADFNSYSGEEIARPFFSNASLESRWLNRWTPQNTNTNIPRLFFTDGPATSINNSFWILDRSYFRFKNLQIGYTLPASLLERIKIKRARVYLNGANLFTITDFPYFDPERPSGVDRGQEGFPNLRVLTGGINLSF